MYREEVTTVMAYNWDFSPWTRGPIEKPWGHDFRVKRVGDKLWIVAPNAELFETIEDAFVAFRLGVCQCVSVQEHLNLLRRFLIAVKLDLVDTDREFVIDDLFGGNRLFYEHYQSWAEAMRFVQHIRPKDGDPSYLILLPEAQAILIMLGVPPIKEFENKKPAKTEAARKRRRKEIIDELRRVAG